MRDNTVMEDRLFVVLNHIISIYIFLNQQFITWSVRADCGSYVVTMYKQTQTTCERKEKK